MDSSKQARRRAPVGVLALIAVLGACNLIQPLDPSLQAGFFTMDADDDYGITVVGGDVVSSAPARNTGGNTRVGFWPADATRSRDHQSCMSWNEGDHRSQQGIALRARNELGRTSAITVTKNVWLGFFWVFNVHVMDSGNADRPYTQIGQFVLGGAVLRGGQPAPGPWRLCARVIGDALSLKVWASDEVEPPWMDGIHGGGVMLPPGWDTPGAPGWYVGHLHPGVSTTYLDREVLDLDVPAEPTTTTTDTTSPPESTTTTEATTTTTDTTAPPGSTTTTDTTVPPEPAGRRAPSATTAEGDTTLTTVPYRAPTDIASAP